MLLLSFKKAFQRLILTNFSLNGICIVLSNILRANHCEGCIYGHKISLRIVLKHCTSIRGLTRRCGWTTLARRTLFAVLVSWLYFASGFTLQRYNFSSRYLFVSSHVNNQVFRRFQFFRILKVKHYQNPTYNWLLGVIIYVTLT